MIEEVNAKLRVQQQVQQSEQRREAEIERLREAHANEVQALNARLEDALVETSRRAQQPNNHELELLRERLQSLKVRPFVLFRAHHRTASPPLDALLGGE